MIKYDIVFLRKVKGALNTLMHEILSDRSLYGVIMCNVIYLDSEGDFSMNKNSRFCEVNFKPLSHPFLHGSSFCYNY